MHHLLYDSLAPFGVLGLGNRETLDFVKYRDAYQQLDEHERLYRKVA